MVPESKVQGDLHNYQFGDDFRTYGTKLVSSQVNLLVGRRPNGRNDSSRHFSSPYGIMRANFPATLWQMCRCVDGIRIWYELHIVHRICIRNVMAMVDLFITVPYCWCDFGDQMTRYLGDVLSANPPVHFVDRHESKGTEFCSSGFENNICGGFEVDFTVTAKKTRCWWLLCIWAVESWRIWNMGIRGYLEA